MKTINELILKVAAIKIGTYALGPGYRAGIWVQGCPFHCKGCIAPEWIPSGGTPASIQDIAEKIVHDPKIEGLTLSGGEPMQQAYSLSKLIALIRKKRPEVNVICFTGYRYEVLQKINCQKGIKEFLSKIDLLIDGPYIQKYNDDKGLRGSSNQRFFYLTDRLSGTELENQPRKLEINVFDGHAFIVGIPPKNFIPAWSTVMNEIKQEKFYEWT